MFIITCALITGFASRISLFSQVNTSYSSLIFCSLSATSSTLWLIHAYSQKDESTAIRSILDLGIMVLGTGYLVYKKRNELPLPITIHD